MQVVPYVGADVAPRAGVDWSGSATLKEAESNIKVGTRLLFEKTHRAYVIVMAGNVNFHWGESSVTAMRGQSIVPFDVRGETSGGIKVARYPIALENLAWVSHLGIDADLGQHGLERLVHLQRRNGRLL
jgi:hypothetical protein